MALGKPGRLRVDQPTITGELRPATDAYTHYSPVMIAALSKDCRPEPFYRHPSRAFQVSGPVASYNLPFFPTDLIRSTSSGAR
jgi:hypothetical protein